MTRRPPSSMTCTGHINVWCDSPGCPGQEVKRKLADFNQLLAAAEVALAHLRYDGALNPAAGQAISMLEAAIAKASPQAPGPG